MATVVQTANNLVADCPTLNVRLGKVDVVCLIDTGSMVSTITEEFFKNYLQYAGVTLQPDNLCLRITTSNGLDIPYNGYLEIDVSVNSLVLPKMAFIVVKDSLDAKNREDKRQVPGLLSMNILGPLVNLIPDGTDLPTLSFVKTALTLQACADVKENVEVAMVKVASTIVFIPPECSVVVDAYVSKCVPFTLAVIEPLRNSDHLPVGVVVASTLVEVGKVFPVRIDNMSSKGCVLRPNTRIGVLRGVDGLEDGSNNLQFHVSVNEIHVNINTTVASHDISKTSDTYTVPIDLSEFDGSEEQLTQTKRLIQKHKDIFAKHDFDLGDTDTVKHNIKTNQTEPVSQTFRRIPPNQYNEVKKHIQQLIDHGIIVESCSPYSAPIVLARKKDGSLRMCVDYRHLNSVTKRDAFPLPRISELIDAPVGAKICSSLDLASGYHQIRVNEADREKTAFITPMGLYEYGRMPFGLCGAPATFQRLMQRCIGDLTYQMLFVYLDDICIYSKTFEEHLAHLDLVFTKLKQHNLKLKPSKCHLFCKEINYLGHVLSENGISTNSDKTKAVVDWPTPRTVKHLRSFLGFASYYHQYIHNFAKIARPLHVLVGESQKHSPKYFRNRWTESCQQSMDELKSKFVSTPILAYADFNKPFILDIDASLSGLGSVLSQVQDGQERVIAYASRALRENEKTMQNYSSFKLELLGLKWAVTEKFKDYLYGTNFTVRTDNNPLSHLATAKLGATEQRWVSSLASFDFKITYRPGKVNRNADGLSRQFEMDTGERSAISNIVAQHTVLPINLQVKISQESLELSFARVLSACSASISAFHFRISFPHFRLTPMKS